MTRLAETLGLAGLLVAAAVLFSRGLDAGANYDEGVYLASADALGRGERLGEHVFASQPPGFYALLRLAVALPGESVAASRALFVAIAVIGVAAAWWTARSLAGPWSGLGAAALLLTAPSYPSESARVAADVPSIVFALGALALLTEAVRRNSCLLGAAAGATAVAAVSVKLFAITAVVPAAAILISARPSRRLVAAIGVGLSAVPLVLLLVHAGEVGALYDGAVGFHNAARDGALNVERVVRSFDPRTVWTLLVAAGAATWLARRAQPPVLTSLWLWALAATGFLIWHRPLLDHHFVLFAASFSIAAGAALGGVPRQRIVVSLLALVVAAGYAQQWRRTDRLAAPATEVAAAAAAVRAATAESEPIVTDLPLIAHLAGRPLPGELVDTSAVRFEAGSLDDACILAVVDATGARVVVAGRLFRTRSELLAKLRERFPTRRRIGTITLFERPRASVRAAPAAARGSCSGRRAARSRSSSGGARRG